jgi:transcriptional regulator NrdR family protein
MKCPKCKKKLKCVDSRGYPGNVRIRKYRCPDPKCGFEETTEEKLNNT